MLKESWKESIDRYNAFWSGEPLDRPPVIIDTVKGYGNPTFNGVGYDYIKYGEDIVKLRNDVYSMWEKRYNFSDDSIPCIAPIYGNVFEAALFMGEIVWGREVTELKPHNPAEDIKSIDEIMFDKSNKYYQKLLDDVTFLSKHAATDYGVCYDGGMSITTAISQLLGGTRFMFDLYDDPDGIRHFAEHVTDILISLHSKVNELTPKPAGGSCHRWINYWNPGRGFWFSEDDAIMMSPEMYREIFLDLDVKLCASTDMPALHWHTAGLHLIPELIKIDNLKMIQLAPDPNGPGFDEILEFCKIIVASDIRVCFQMGYDQDKVRKIFNTLPSDSCLFYLSYADSFCEANRILIEIEKMA